MPTKDQVIDRFHTFESDELIDLLRDIRSDSHTVPIYNKSSKHIEHDFIELIMNNINLEQYMK
jgi:pantothenate kinase